MMRRTVLTSKSRRARPSLSASKSSKRQAVAHDIEAVRQKRSLSSHRFKSRALFDLKARFRFRSQQKSGTLHRMESNMQRLGKSKALRCCSRRHLTWWRRTRLPQGQSCKPALTRRAQSKFRNSPTKARATALETQIQSPICSSTSTTINLNLRAKLSIRKQSRAGAKTGLSSTI